jgi:hypothetical protein
MGVRMFTIKNTVKIASGALIVFSFNVLSFPALSITATNNIPNPYSIGGVRIRMTESQVRSIWGKSVNRSEIRLACLTGFSITYSQSEVVLEKRKGNIFSVFAIKTKNRKWKTEKGIKVGDSIYQAKKVYRIKGSGSKEWYVENSNYRPGNLKFTTDSNQKITKIDLIENYDNC